MFVVLLRFSDNRGQVGQFMDAHREWLQRGFDDGVFLLAGSLQPGLGGGILAHDISLPELNRRVGEDPFVVHDVVQAEVLEIDASRADDRLAFLVN